MCVIFILSIYSNCIYPKIPVLEHLSAKLNEADDIPCTAITVKELQANVQDWMKNRHNVELHFNPLFAIDELREMGLLTVKHLGKNSAGNIWKKSRSLQFVSVIIYLCTLFFLPYH